MPGQPLGLPHSLHSAPPGLPQFHGLNPAAMMNMGISPAIASQMAANMAAHLPPGMQQAGCVVLVSNLDEEVGACLRVVNRIN